jgi:hypothetical protein
MSLAKRHQAECKARIAAAQLSAQATAIAEGQSAANVNFIPDQNAPVEILQMSMQQDLAALHALTDVQKKIALKKEQLIPKWTPYITQYKESGANHPFEPLVWFCIWLLDVEQIDTCIEFSDLAMLQQQKLPSNFTSSTLDTFIAEGIHDWAQRQLKAGHSAEPFLTQVLERVESKQWLVTHPIALNKIYKLVAQFAEVEQQFEKAEKFYLKCVEVNPEKHGVKTALQKVQQKLGKA